jgi:RecB family exonuclease
VESLPPPPRVAKLTSISPTRAAALKACPLRVAFAADGAQAPLRRLSPFAALGLATHRLIERASKGEFAGVAKDDLGRTLDVAWSDEIENQRKALDAAWPDSEVPAPRRWPYYEQIRTPLLRWLSERLRGSDPVSEKLRSVSESRAGTLAVEEWLQDPNSEMCGRVDRVESMSNGGVRVVDIKSQAFPDTEIRESHESQLLIYAFLWHATRGTWPTEGCIQRVNGTRLCTPIDSGRAIAFVSGLLAELAEYNDAVDQAGLPVATPSTEACLHCDYKVGCPAFFAVLNPAWDSFMKHVLGHVESVNSVGAGYALKLKVVSTNVEQPVGNDPQKALAIRNLCGKPPPAGALVAITELRPTRAPGQLTAAWNTSGWIWPNSGICAHAQDSADHRCHPT